MKIEITITDNEAIMSIPMGNDAYSNSLIITKEAFIECYERWVKPRIDEVKHGRWVNDIRHSGWTCTICNYHEGNSTDNFCPNCGAKMDKEIERYKKKGRE